MSTKTVEPSMTARVEPANTIDGRGALRHWNEVVVFDQQGNPLGRRSLGSLSDLEVERVLFGSARRQGFSVPVVLDTGERVFVRLRRRQGP